MSVAPNETTHTTSSWTKNGVNWIASASTAYTTGDSYRTYQAFYNSLYTTTINTWSPTSGSYPSGTYTGSFSTNVSGTTINGEWLQIDSNIPLIMNKYYFYTRNNGGLNYIKNLPKTYVIAGSNDGTTWYRIQDGNIIANPCPTLNNVSQNTSTYDVTTSGTATQSSNNTLTGYSTSINFYTKFRIIATSMISSSISGGNSDNDNWLSFGWNPIFITSLPLPTITPAANQIVNNFTLLNNNITSTLTARSNSAGPLTYYLNTSSATSYGNASISTSTSTGSTFVVGKLWVAVGYGTNTIAYSSNGTIWTGLGYTIFGSYGASIAWNGTLWVAGGSGSDSIAYSSNGTIWTGLGKPNFSVGYGVAWNGTLWVAVGAGGGNTMAYSSNGTIWTGLGNTIFLNNGYGVAWNGTLWVAVGNGTGANVNTIAYSSNGTTWTGLGKTIFENYGQGVAWNGTLWVAFGYGTNHSIAYSSNGTIWTGLGATIFSSGGSGAEWNGTLWVASGSGTNSIAYSSNGTIWTGLGATIFSFVKRIAWNGTLWVAIGGSTNSIAYSSNGTTWTGITGTSIFSYYGYGVASNAGYVPVTLYNGNVSITGPGTINTYVTVPTYGTYGPITTPTLAGSINVLKVPTIRPAATQTITF